METIKDIYSNDDYYPFIEYCDSHGYSDMSDLTKCEFHKLRNEADISPRLLSKIKIIYISYCKKHSAEFTPVKKVTPKSVKGSLSDEKIAEQLEMYFRNNSDKLIHIADISKIIDKKVKRLDIIRVLNNASWCKAVDDTTFFYSAQ